MSHRRRHLVIAAVYLTPLTLLMLFVLFRSFLDDPVELLQILAGLGFVAATGVGVCHLVEAFSGSDS